ncbi:MAG: MBL fold metallo-hydrolase [Gemmatimonadetes bacterium]|nr:MBL fold metallo-hydrolase [Gemmatimonadota bacterium]
MSTALVRSLALALLAAAPAAFAQAPGCSPMPPGAVRPGPAFSFNTVKPGIIHAVGTGTMAVGANASIIVNERDLVLVDAGLSPAALCVLLEELKTQTPKPVRTVILTHFHFDHAHGSQVLGPDVEIIGSSFTRAQLAAGNSVRGRGYENFIKTLPAQVAAAKAARDTATDPRRKDALAARITLLEQEILADAAVIPTTPTLTVDDHLTLYRDGREIQVRYIGRAHTGGDLIVYLPRERVVCTGDMLTVGVPFLADGFVREWPATLDRLKQLNFDVVLPGHGAAFKDRERIDWLQAVLGDLQTKVTALHDAKVSVADAAKQLDMRAHAGHYPGLANVGFDPSAVERIYALLDGK